MLFNTENIVTADQAQDELHNQALSSSYNNQAEKEVVKIKLEVIQQPLFIHKLTFKRNP